MLSGVRSFDHMDAVLHQGADGSISFLREVLVADFDVKFASLVGDPIMVTPVALPSGVARHCCGVSPR